MIAEYTMKRNGKWYKAGDEVPEINAPASSDSRYTKTDINRMSVSDLRQIVRNTGVENADIMTGSEMKEYLIDLFGL